MCARAKSGGVYSTCVIRCVCVCACRKQFTEYSRRSTICPGPSKQFTEKYHLPGPRKQFTECSSSTISQDQVSQGLAKTNCIIKSQRCGGGDGDGGGGGGGGSDGGRGAGGGGQQRQQRQQHQHQHQHLPLTGSARSLSTCAGMHTHTHRCVRTRCFDRTDTCSSLLGTHTHVHIPHTYTCD